MALLAIPNALANRVESQEPFAKAKPSGCLIQRSQFVISALPVIIATVLLTMTSFFDERWTTNTRTSSKSFQSHNKLSSNRARAFFNSATQACATSLTSSAMATQVSSSVSRSSDICFVIRSCLQKEICGQRSDLKSTAPPLTIEQSSTGQILWGNREAHPNEQKRLPGPTNRSQHAKRFNGELKIGASRVSG